MIEIQEYTSEWPANFETLRSRIWPAVSHCADRIEHVGSTSVEGLCAKPIIDIDIVISKPEVLQEVIAALANIGYTHRGDLGIEGRQAFLHNSTDIRHNLYVCEENCLAFKNHITLRDHLRKNPECALEYSQLKQSLATASGDDIDVYVEGKSEFILAVLQRYNLADSELDAIRAANKKPEKRT